MRWTWVVVAVAILFVVWLIATYNRLVRRRNRVEDAWAGIDVQLKRRADLVPNLVTTVQGYQVHERETLERVTQARNEVVQAAGRRAAGEADDRLEQALTNLYATAEAYPDLKASRNFLELQRELTQLEEEISFARRYYNALVQELNTSVQTFPTVLIAGLLGFRRAEYFKAEGAERAVPTAAFGT